MRKLDDEKGNGNEIVRKEEKVEDKKKKCFACSILCSRGGSFIFHPFFLFFPEYEKVKESWG